MEKHDYYKGVLFLITGALFFSILQALGKQVGFLNAFERTFYLSVVASSILLVIVFIKKEPMYKGKFLYLNLRAIFGFVSTIFVFLASVKEFPLTNLTLLVSTSTIFSLIFSVLWLKEKMNGWQWVAVFISFCGVILIVQPSSLGLNIYALYALLGGMIAGLAYTVIRKLKDYASPLVITCYFCLFCTVVSLPFVIYYGFTPLRMQDIIAVVAMGVAMSVAQVSISYAYRFAQASKISVYMYTQNLFSLFIGVLFFKEMPNMITLVGGCLIILAGIMNFYVNYQISHQKAK